MIDKDKDSVLWMLTESGAREFRQSLELVEMHAGLDSKAFADAVRPLWTYLNPVEETDD